MTAPRAGEPGVSPMSAPRAGEPGAIRARLPHLRLPLLACAVLGAVGIPAAALLRGPAGAAGVAAGIGLVILSYLISSLSVAWADAVHPRLIMSVGLVTYATKIVFLGVVMAAVAATGWPGLPDLGVSIIVAVVVWTGAHLTWALRSPLPTVDRSPEH
ncbi:hypothetical protein ACQPYA_25950 [Micromonospora sp. CA-263727]|uniref:hypothetical protein n=1 Tax=Micromonospora sp. CA-263727 TaxID=3239967 RepID=UPI003D94B75E